MLTLIRTRTLQFEMTILAKKYQIFQSFTELAEHRGDGYFNIVKGAPGSLMSMKPGQILTKQNPATNDEVCQQPERGIYISR